MPNAYTLEQVQAFIPGKTWSTLPPEMQDSVNAYYANQTLQRYYVIVPTYRADDLANLIEGKSNQVSAVMVISGELIVSLDQAADTTALGYAHEFLSGFSIRFVDDSEFPPDTSGV